MVDCKHADSMTLKDMKGCMRVNGLGTVKVMADMAVASLGIVTENVSLKVAQEANATKFTWGQ